MNRKSIGRVVAAFGVWASLNVSTKAALVGHWLFNDAPGQWQAADSSGNGMNATNTAHANITFGTTGAPIGGTAPFGGTCVTFAGGTLATGNELKIPAFTSLNGANHLTISMWFQATNSSQAFTYEGLLMTRDVQDNLGTGRNYGLAINGSAVTGPWRTEGRVSGSQVIPAATYTLATLPWMHVALVWSGSSASVYTNGVLAQQVTGITDTGIITNGVWYFGYDPSATYRHIKGSISDAAVWNEALTAAQINQIFTNGLNNGIDAVTTIYGSGSTWAATGGGNWSTVANWNAGVPNSTGVFASFGGSILAPSTVTNDSPHSIGTISIQSTNSYTLAGSSTLTIGGPNPGVTVLSGTHSITTPLASSGTPLTFNMAGTLNLASQSFADGVIISGSGALVVTNLGNSGGASGIGASSADAANLTLNGGTLRYTGPGDSSDRNFGLAVGSSTIDASGTGALQFTNSAVTVGAVSSGSATLVLAGTNTANNSMLVTLGDGSGKVSLTKSGTGKWIFGNANNSFTGGTVVNQGVLVLNNTNAVATSSGVTVAAGAVLDVSALTGYILPTGKAISGSGAVSGSFVAGTGSINPGGSSAVGTLTFSNTLTFQGGTTINYELATLAPGGYDKVLVDGDLNLKGITTLAISSLSPPNIPSGTYTLIQYSGNLTGGATNFAVSSAYANGFSVIVDTIAKTVSLTVTQPNYWLEWAGDNFLNYWNSSDLNWLSNGIAGDDMAWQNGLTAVFDDNSANPTVNATSGSIYPGSVLVSNSIVGYTINAVMGGSMSLTKTGTSSLFLGRNNTYTGGTALNQGTILLGNNNGLGQVLTDTNVLLNIASGATLDLNYCSLGGSLGVLNVSGNGVDGNGAIVNSGTTLPAYNLHNLTLTGDTLIGTPNMMGVRGPTTAPPFSSISMNGHTLTWNGSGSFYIGDCIVTNGNLVIQQGTLESWANGATTSVATFAANTSISISNGASWLIGNNGGIFACNGKLNLGGTLIGQFAGASINGPVNLLAGYNIYPSNSTSITFYGPVGGSIPLNINSSGNVVLNATNSYTGNTVITVGGLVIGTNGSIATSPVIQNDSAMDVSSVNGGFQVVSGQMLQGVGTNTGNITIASGATLSPGDAGIGTITFNNNLTLAGNAILDVNTNGPVNDRIVTHGTNYYGGILTINNLGGNLTTNSSFMLFSTNGVGNFTAFSPVHPNSDSTLAWKFNSTNGTLSVVPAVTVPTPEPLRFTNQGGTNLTFSWTQSGWKMQVQTNTLNIGLSTNWFDYPGGTTPPVSVPIAPNNPSVFYRLKNQ